jgi:hypothetical protein
MKRTRQGPPAIEPLEGRLLLSTGVTAARGPAAIVAAARAHLKLEISVDGTIQGTWLRQVAVPSSDDALVLQGTGSVDPLGTVSVSTALQAPGLAIRGKVSGPLTLTSGQGTVTLQLEGTLPSVGFSASATTYRYTITGGTGAYAGVWGSGRASLQLRPEIRPATPPGQAAPDYVIAPSFTLTLHPHGAGAA